MQLRGEVAAAQQAAQRAKSDAEAAALRAVDARLRAQGTDGERDTTALNRRLDGLATTLTELSARVDELSSRVEALGRQVRTPAPSTSAGNGSATPAPPRVATATPAAPAPSTATPAAPPPVGQRPATNALQPQDIYQAAYIDFSKGSYALAMAGFREFLRRYPDHALAGNAQYWIGEGYLSQARTAANAGQTDKAAQELESAVQEFRKVLANYPRSEKAPTALYKEALALIDLKQPAVAQQRLEYLVANFPQAEETPLARERLSTLKTAAPAR
jgi:TolA-binding protein